MKNWMEIRISVLGDGVHGQSVLAVVRRAEPSRRLPTGLGSRVEPGVQSCVPFTQLVFAVSNLIQNADQCI